MKTSKLRTIATSLALSTWMALTLAPVEVKAQAKLTNSGICYTPQDPQYHQFYGTRHFMNLVDCLDHGRSPDYDVEAAKRNHNTRLNNSMRPLTRSAERDARIQHDVNVLRFWTSRPAGCRDVREILMARTATRPVEWTPNGCSVASGRWLDPFTQRQITDPERVEIDHIIPLEWAWKRGAHRWPAGARESFYHDVNNVVATTPDFRRERAGQSPLEWTPPEARHQCAHFERVLRMLRAYDFDVSTSEVNEVIAKRHQACQMRVHAHQ